MRKKTKKRIWSILGAMLLILFIGFYFPIRVYSTVSQPTTVFVNPGDTITSVSANLLKKNLIYSDSVFKFAVRLNGGRVQIGEYDIPRGASIWKIASMLSRGHVALTSVVIPEGLTVLQIKELLNGNKELVGSVECDSNMSWGRVCDLGDGDIFPDTYYVARGTSRLAVLDLAYKKMQSIKSAFTATHRFPPAPLQSWQDVIILASIVQRETPRVSEMKYVASVYINRLRRGMRLQADPTVVYALTDGYGDMQGAPLLRGHLKIDSPYNTYMNKGLPPAPIANVGRDAIRAVMEPADTNYLYFVADGQGGHKFADTYEQHLKNHADWREIKKLNNPEINFENN